MVIIVGVLGGFRGCCFRWWAGLSSLRRDRSGPRMLRQLKGAAKPSMPPKGEPRPTAEEIAVLDAWVKAGTPGPVGVQPDRLDLVVPKIIAPRSAPSRRSTSPATARPWPSHIARIGLDLPRRKGSNRRALADAPRLPGQGHRRALQRRRLAPGDGFGRRRLGGVAAIWKVEDGSLVRRFEGHRDLLYDAELSPDGKRPRHLRLRQDHRALGCRDRQALANADGHNGAVYDVAFSPDGRFLVSASADDTCKVWRVDDGLRLDTLPQPLKEEYCCTFSPDGRSIVAGGADNTIRVWKFVSRDKPEINPMVLARFAHEGPIVRLAFTPDGSRLVSLAEDRTVKAWDTTDYTELQALGRPARRGGRRWRSPATGLVPGRPDGRVAGHATRSRGRASLEARDGRSPPRPSRSTEPGTAGEVAEREPNNTPAQATAVDVPARDHRHDRRRRAGPRDVDLFASRPGPASRGSSRSTPPASGLEARLVHRGARRQGNRVPRVLLQAVRNSYFTFRGKDDIATDDFRVFNWEEMRLNEYLYANGEVVKLWLYPRGPDSGFVVYPGEGSAGATSTRRRWRTPWASPATSSSRTRPARTLSPTACRSFRSTSTTTTTASASWARTRDCTSPRRPMASTWSRSRTSAACRGPTSSTP